MTVRASNPEGLKVGAAVIGAALLADGAYLLA